MMDSPMFCFQCEQTAKGTGCVESAGVCGKSLETALLQDSLTGALIGLAKAAEHSDSYITEETTNLIIESLFMTLTNVNFDPSVIRHMITRVHKERNRITGLPCPRADADMRELWIAQKDIRSLKSLMLFGLRGMAAYAYHAAAMGYRTNRIDRFFYKALCKLDSNESIDSLLEDILEEGRVNYQCMQLLERAYQETYGTPRPTDVSYTIEKGPFIIVTGHDLHDIKQLLEETENLDLSVYTHGEMLPAHAYPELKKYRNLKGHFGTAWQNQRNEFDEVPAPILYTSNCLMPPRESYRDRVLTTGPVYYPGTQHISSGDRYDRLIEKALELGGYRERREMQGINGGRKLVTGYSYRYLLGHIREIVDAIISGRIRHIFVVGGCDGAKPGRNYYTEFVKNTPKDSLIFTLACGKFRFNDLSLGTVVDFPRIMDMGQCNDAYGVIQLAIALSESLHCRIADLPLSIVLSWYEQKAVCVLLSMLSVGIRNILLGPSLPAFISPKVLTILKDRYGLSLITTPQEDIHRLLGND